MATGCTALVLVMPRTVTVAMQLTSVFAYDAHNYWVTVTSLPLYTGQHVTLHLSFIGRLDDDVIGFYRSSYTDPSTGRQQ